MPEEPPQKPEGKRLPRRRFSRIIGPLLVVSAVVVLTQLFGSAPRERAVNVKLTDPKSVTELELLWLSDDGQTAIAKSELHFRSGEAPSSLTTKLSAVDGLYRLQIQIRRNGQIQKLRQRRIELRESTSAITVPID